MTSIPRALPAALAVLVFALALGLASSLWTSSDAEAGSQPSPVAEASVVDTDSCTTFTYGYMNPIGGFYGYPFYSGFVQPFAFPCVSEAYCVGANPYLLYQQQFLICPGPPAVIEMPATNAATCASATNFTVKVRDANGLNVLATPVSFSVSPFGMITGTVETNGGEATASLTTPTKTSGLLTVTVTAGSVTRTGTIDVSCSAPGSVAYGGGGGGGSSAAQAPAPAPSGGSTGGGGGGSTGGGGGGGY